MGEISESVERLELLNEKLENLYRTELEIQISNALGIQLSVGCGTCWEGEGLKDYHFPVNYGNEEFALIFPFTKQAYVRRLDPVPPEFNDDLDDFGIIQNLLQKRGYTVHYGFDQVI